MNDKFYLFKIVIIGIITGLCNGLFGAGGGIIVVPSMVYFLNVNEHDAHATAIAVILPLAIISAFIYFRNGYLEFDKVFRVAAGGVIGGMAGAWLLNRVSSYWLRKIFALFIIAAAVRMIL